MTAVTLARAVTASTQSHDTEVTQTTSGKKLIRADGSRGWYLSAQGIVRAPASLQKILLALAITASTQSHDTEVTQTTSGKKLIRADGSRGWYLHLTGMTEAFTPAGGGGFVGLTYAFPALTVAA